MNKQDLKIMLATAKPCILGVMCWQGPGGYLKPRPREMLEMKLPFVTMAPVPVSELKNKLMLVTRAAK
jgi:hypothetical protein